jgi:hypothetical protein
MLPLGAKEVPWYPPNKRKELQPIDAKCYDTIVVLYKWTMDSATV